MSIFKKATKTQSKLRLAIAGPSGSGKTYTALSVATALADGRPVALVDTEHGSASKYASLFEFDVAEMHPPFHPDKFISAINEAQQAGYAVVILDSITHAWSGTGGVLDIVDEAAKRSRSGNTYMAWKEGTPVQNRMIDAIVQSGLHVIVTMRSKTEYILADAGGGKQAPRKVGMAPVQRDQFEYEFDVVFDMDIQNNAVVTKTRCPALNERVFTKPGAEVAGILRDWLSDGAPVAPAPQPVQTPAQHRQIEQQPEPAAHRAPVTNGTQPAPDDDILSDKSLPEPLLTFVGELRSQERPGAKRASEKQHQYGVSIIDGITGDQTHRQVFKTVFQRDVTKDEPLGLDAFKLILRYLSDKKSVKQGDAWVNVDNEDYSIEHANMIRVIHNWAMETRGQMTIDQEPDVHFEESGDRLFA